MYNYDMQNFFQDFDFEGMEGSVYGKHTIAMYVV